MSHDIVTHAYKLISSKVLCMIGMRLYYSDIIVREVFHSSDLLLVISNVYIISMYVARLAEDLVAMMCQLGKAL